MMLMEVGGCYAGNGSMAGNDGGPRRGAAAQVQGRGAAAQVQGRGAAAHVPRPVPPHDAELLSRWASGDDPLAVRAAIVLLAHDGLRNADIARRLGVSRQTVSTWRQRYATDGTDGLRDRPHPGRPGAVDEASIVVRALLAPADRRSTRALASECGLSHTLVAAIRQRWHLTPDHSSVPVIPTRPPLPDGEIWVLGLYHDTQCTVMLLGSRPQRSATLIASMIDPGTLDAVDGALAVAANGPHPARDDQFDMFLLQARRHHPNVRLLAVLLQYPAEGTALAERCGRAGVTHHLIPARSTWRSFVRAAIGIDSVRHPESSQRVHLDLASALTRYAAGRGPRREPVRWLRETLPARGDGPARLTAAHRPGSGSGANQIDLGSFNESVVIETVRLAGSITRGEISERTRLTQQSVSRITRSLLARGLLVEDLHRYSTAGKPRTPVRLRDDAAHALGIHLDPEVLTAVVVDLSGSIVASRSEPITTRALVDQVTDLGEAVLAGAGRSVADDTFLGIGVATPGPVDTASGTILDPPLMAAWRDVPLLSLLEKRFPCPIVIEKDCTAAAIGERWIGRDRRARDFVYLYLGTGVGAGLVLNGDIYRGLTANAGEFGQLCAIALGRVDANGRPEILPECNPVASVPALAQHSAPIPPSKSVPGDPSAAYHAACAVATAGVGAPAESRAADAVRQVAAAIGQGTVGMVDLLDVGLVVVGGPFCTDAVAGLYLAEIERVVNAFPIARRMRQVIVERSVIGKEAAAIGAASTIFHATFTPRLRGGGAG
jgi:predicted NBD/HSP70 family sugar kinase/transposase